MLNSYWMFVGLALLGCSPAVADLSDKQRGVQWATRFKTLSQDLKSFSCEEFSFINKGRGNSSKLFLKKLFFDLAQNAKYPDFMFEAGKVLVGSFTKDPNRKPEEADLNDLNLGIANLALFTGGSLLTLGYEKNDPATFTLARSVLHMVRRFFENPAQFPKWAAAFLSQGRVLTAGGARIAGTVAQMNILQKVAVALMSKPTVWTAGILLSAGLGIAIGNRIDFTFESIRKAGGPDIMKGVRDGMEWGMRLGNSNLIDDSTLADRSAEATAMRYIAQVYAGKKCGKTRGSELSGDQGESPIRRGE